MDIKSKADPPANLVSNFNPYEFWFCGVKCACAEGPLQAFKEPNPAIQIELCKLTGKEAKLQGQTRNESWKATQTLWWQGEAYPRDSYEYQELLDLLFEALARNESFRENLLATGYEILTHSIGSSDPSQTILTEAELCLRLMSLRERIRHGLI